MRKWHLQIHLVKEYWDGTSWGFSASNGMANSFGNTNNGSNNGFGLSKTGLGHRVLTNSKSKLGPFGNQNSFPSGNNTIFHPLNPKNNEISKITALDLPMEEITVMMLTETFFF